VPRVADYTIITDSWNASFEIEFTIPESFEPGNRCVLTFMIATRGIEDVVVRMRLNGNEVWVWDFGEDDPPPQCFQEVIKTGVVRAGKNVLSFDPLTGPTALKLSDVVLWWQANV
jgi:hypothetical protein